MGATPDSLLILAAALVLWTTTILEVTDDGRWWLAIGAAAGLAIASKYTGFFLCGSLTIWLLANKRARRWLRSIWPYSGALIAILFFVPTLYWNATHGFASFGFQIGRVGSVRNSHFLEFLGGQIALASPLILVLAGFGLARNPITAIHPRSLSFAAAVVWPALLYFAFHALHDRVQGNWPCFAYPALALLAAQSFANGNTIGVSGEVLKLARGQAFSFAAIILALAYAQAFFGVLQIGKRDPIARMMGVGFPSISGAVANEAAHQHASAIVTTNYSLTGWLTFYAQSHLPVVQIANEVRFLSSPRATASDLVGTLLYVTANPRGELPEVSRHFAQIRFVTRLVRERGGDAIDAFYVYRISGFHGATIGRIP